MKIGRNDFLKKNGLPIISTLLLIMSTPLGWMDQPIAGWLRGYQIRLSENLPSLISYGSLCLILGLLSLITLSRQWRWMAMITGAINFTLMLHFFLNFSLFDSKRLLPIVDLNQQQGQIINFTSSLPPNLGEEPTFDASILTNSILDRFKATLHFATVGWYAAILGGLLLFIVFLKSNLNPRVKKVSFYSFLSLILFGLLLTLPPFLVAEYHREKGDYYMEQGLHAKAIQEYEDAKQLDRNLNYMKEFHYSLGKAYFLTGRTDKADYYIYRAKMFLKEYNFHQAIFYFTQAKAFDPSTPNTVHQNFLTWAYVQFGLFENHRGIKSLPIELWKRAIEIDPTQIQPHYFLSRAYYDISSYEESIAEGLQFLKLTKDNIMRADISSNIGDAYYKLKKFDLARQYYVKSALLDYYFNMRAMLELVGR